MKGVLMDKRFKINVPVFILLLFVPALIWGEGYKEETLFNKKLYSAQELRQKVETHKKELQGIALQIKILETDLDWLILKINQIQDFGRPVSSDLKAAALKKEKKIGRLNKLLSRLEHLIQYYSATLSNNKDQDRIEGILKKKRSEHPAPLPIQHNGATLKTIVSKPPAQIKTSRKGNVNNEQDQDNRITKSKLQAAIKNSGLGDWVEIGETGTCLRMETTLPILFPSGSARVANEYKIFLKKLAFFLKPYDVTVLVNGYADNVPIKNKTYPSNFELGAARAANIVHELVHSGLNPAIFKIESSGKYRSAAKKNVKTKFL